jgi:hypothetical protein
MLDKPEARTKEKYTNDIQVSTRVYKSKTHYTKCTKPPLGHPQRYGEPSSLDHAKDQDPSSTCSPSGVLIPTCEKTKKTESWISKG